MGKESIPEELLKNINKCIRRTRNEVAKQVVNDIRQEYRTVIWKFYKHYKPRMYQRSYETLFASNIYRAGGDYRKITTWKDGEFIVKFSVGAEYIRESYEDPTEWVFQRTFEQGIHGWKPLTVSGIMSGKQKASEMGWRGSVTQPKRPLSPPPKALMDKWFELYTTPSSLDKICKPILKNNIKKYIHN